VKRLPQLALGAFVLGVALMIPFEYTVTRILGVAAMFGAIVAGVFAIASPELLSDERDEPEL
jgi:hypothetical protein